MIAEAEEEAEDEEPAPRAFFGAGGGGWEEEERFEAPGLREEDEEDEAEVDFLAAAFAVTNPLKLLPPAGGKYWYLALSGWGGFLRTLTYAQTLIPQPCGKASLWSCRQKERSVGAVQASKATRVLVSSKRRGERKAMRAKVSQHPLFRSFSSPLLLKHSNLLVLRLGS